MPSNIKVKLKENISSILSEKDLIEVAKDALLASKDNVRKKTKSGINPNQNGGRYQEYSDNYKKKKGSSTVDLRLKGTLDSGDFFIRKNKKSASLLFRGNNDKGIKNGVLFAIHQRGIGNNPKRPIFPESKDQIPKVVIDAIFNSLKKKISKNTK